MAPAFLAPRSARGTAAVALALAAGSAAVVWWRRGRARAAAWSADALSARVLREASERAATTPALRPLLRALVLSRDGLDGAVAAVLADALEDAAFLPKARLEPLLLGCLLYTSPSPRDS